jgi:hypothetical protein
MSTNSSIAIELEDGTVQQVYCHWDGYPEYVGKLLNKYYLNSDIVSKLIEGGSISSLSKEIGEKHPFGLIEAKCQGNLPQDAILTDYYDLYDQMTTYYARDRGEDLRVNTFSDFEQYLKTFQVQEFNYIYRKTEGSWKWFMSRQDYDSNNGIFSELTK